jgi:hypothetical protein
MQDILFITIIIAAFALLGALVKGTERLRQGAKDE